MSDLSGKRVLLGITGGIAAYKSALLVRELVTAGAEVRVVMTEAAQAFITPLTMQALSANPVYTKLIDVEQEGAMGHIRLARWADLVLIAPATADFMAKITYGLANDLLSTLCLATSAPIAMAPAMNQQMWLNSATQDNARILESRDIMLWGPADGEQACGETGPGRMVEPEQLLQQARNFFHQGLLSGVNILMTAGPTREPLDPVRFIGNRSSGKMGFALAAALREQGADVHLVSGPVCLPTPAGVVCTAVETAQEMHAAVMAQVDDCHLFIAAAAVADYRPKQVADQKIKKQKDNMQVELQPNPDIVAEVAARNPRPFTVGFAAETENLEAYARGKLEAKGLDMIAANQVGGTDGGFESENNAITLIWKSGQMQLPMMSKPELARRIAQQIAEHYHAQHTT